MLLNDRTYQFLKRFVQVVLPGLATLYFTLGQIWAFPMIEQVLGTCTALGTFLGLILGISTKAYNASDTKYDGSLMIENTEDGSRLKLMDVDPNTLLTKSEITFKINSNVPG